MTALAADSKIENKQNEIRKTKQDTLQCLYKADPKAKSAVEEAAGCADFSKLRVKILVAGSGNGQDIAVNNKTKQERFMKMFELQPGPRHGSEKVPGCVRLR